MFGNIEKFAENQGLQAFFFKEKVSQNIVTDIKNCYFFES